MRQLTYWITLIFIFTIPFENSFVNSVGSMTKLLGVLAFASWLAMLAITDQIRKPNSYIIVSILFLLWSAFSILWSNDPAMTFDMTITYAQLVLMALVIWNVFTTREMIQSALWAYLLGAYVTASIVLRNFAIGATNYAEGLTLARYSAGGQDPNDLGVLLAIGVPIAIWLGSLQNSSRIRRFFVYMYVPIATFGILLTASRTAMIALAIGILFAFVMPSNLRVSTRVIAFVLLIGALFYIQPLVPTETIERLGEVGDSVSSGDFTGRGAIWVQGIALFVDNPILGVGSGAFKNSIDLHRVSHNVAISIAAELGIVGIILYGTMFLLVILAAVRHPSPMRYLWLAVLACWFIAAMSLNWEFRKQTWVLFAMIIASAYPVTNLDAQTTSSSHLLSEPRPSNQAVAVDQALGVAAHRGQVTY